MNNAPIHAARIIHFKSYQDEKQQHLRPAFRTPPDPQNRPRDLRPDRRQRDPLRTGPKTSHWQKGLEHRQGGGSTYDPGPEEAQ